MREDARVVLEDAKGRIPALVEHRAVPIETITAAGGEAFRGKVMD